MGWVSPSSYIDPDNKWNQEVKVYDRNLDTAADTLITTSKTWSSYVEYTIASISCDKIRFNALYNASNINNISIDVYYKSAWNNIYEGVYTNHDWVEKVIGSTQNITAVRVKFYSKSASITAYLYELELNDLNSGAKGAGDLYGTYGQRIKLTAHAADIDADVTWFPVTVSLALAAIDAGSEASDRAAGALGSAWTYINYNGAANTTGTITSIEMYAESGLTLTNVWVATFYEGESGFFSARDHVNLANVEGGSKVTRTVDINTNPIALDVGEGDFIGIYSSGAALSNDTEGGSGIYRNAGDETANSDVEYSLLSSRILSLYGTGATAEAPTEDNAIMFGIDF